MALTLPQAALQTSDPIMRGVIETVIEDGGIVPALPFEGITGNAFKYVQEVSPGTVNFYAVNDTWTEGSATVRQMTTGLAIMGGDADVDNFLQRTMSDPNDQRATQIRLKAKALRRKFENAAITGDSATDANSFDGLRKLCVAAQTLLAGTNGAALTLPLIDQMLDLLRGRKADALLMSRRTRRQLKALLETSAHYIETGTAFGRQVMMYDGIPVVASDFMPDTETAGSGTALSSIYAAQFEWGDGLAGVQNGTIEVVDVGQLESKNAERTRLRWYCGLVLFRDSAVARLQGLTA